jgi:hypothetical protein
MLERRRSVASFNARIRQFCRFPNCLIRTGQPDISCHDVGDLHGFCQGSRQNRRNEQYAE